MMKFGTLSYLAIHRHTGGLEMCYRPQIPCCLIHRHTGGLEIWEKVLGKIYGIHRHTGGLEKFGCQTWL